MNNRKLEVVVAKSVFASRKKPTTKSAGSISLMFVDAADRQYNIDLRFSDQYAQNDFEAIDRRLSCVLPAEATVNKPSPWDRKNLFVRLLVDKSSRKIIGISHIKIEELYVDIAGFGKRDVPRLDISEVRQAYIEHYYGGVYVGVVNRVPKLSQKGASAKINFQLTCNYHFWEGNFKILREVEYALGAVQREISEILGTSFSKSRGRLVRFKRSGDQITAIGHILDDRWFEPHQFLEECWKSHQAELDGKAQAAKMIALLKELADGTAHKTITELFGAQRNDEASDYIAKLVSAFDTIMTPEVANLMEKSVQMRAYLVSMRATTQTRKHSSPARSSSTGGVGPVTEI